MSIQAKVVNFVLRHTFKPKPGAKLHPRAVRARVGKVTKHQPPVPKDITRRPVPADAARGLCPAEWLSHAQPQRTVLYFHGGGYFFCNLDTHRPVCAYLARTAQARVLSVDYRLAPEHPYPAAVDDALAWYRELLATTAPQQLLVAGDSAGGGLVLACLLAARDAGLPMPAGAILFSPWADLACAGETMQTKARDDVMFTPDALPQAAALYLNGHAPTEPLISPVYADLRGLPPLMIHASRHEVLLSDSTRLQARAQAAGVRCDLRLRDRMPHVWPTMVMLPEARETLRECGAFAAEVTGVRAAA